MTVTLGVEAAGRTYVGLVRRRNEDAMYLGERLFVVADGLGDHVAGDIASTSAITTLQAYDERLDPEQLATALGRAVRDANTDLRRKVDATPELAGMGTTLVALLLSETTGPVANVGDSRAYLLRHLGGGSSQTTQIIEDDTYGNLVADAVTVPNLPERLARFLDGRPDGRSPDITPAHLQLGDRVLLCSDGLSSHLPHDLIHTTLNSTNNPGAVADQLVALAIEHGAPDNVTVIVIDIRNE